MSPQQEHLPAALYKHMLDQTTDTVVLFDLDFRYLYVNPAFVRLVGRRSDADILGKTDEELGMDKEQIAAWRAAWQLVKDTGIFMLMPSPRVLLASRRRRWWANP